MRKDKYYLNLRLVYKKNIKADKLNFLDHRKEGLRDEKGVYILKDGGRYYLPTSAFSWEAPSLLRYGEYRKFFNMTDDEARYANVHIHNLFFAYNLPVNPLLLSQAEEKRLQSFEKNSKTIYIIEEVDQESSICTLRRNICTYARFEDAEEAQKELKRKDPRFLYVINKIECIS